MASIKKKPVKVSLEIWSSEQANRVVMILASNGHPVTIDYGVNSTIVNIWDFGDKDES